MSEVRRSERIRTKPIEENHSPDDGVGGVQSDEETTVQDYHDESESSSDEEDNNDNDEDYEEPTKRGKRAVRNPNSTVSRKRAKSGQKTSSSSNRTNSKASRKDKELLSQIEKDFQRTEMFDILASSEDLSLDELLREWLATYNSDRDQFLQEFINLLLCCCGATARVENHDVHSNESSNETIGEVQLMFQKQKYHEFYLLVSKNNKKRAKYQHLYVNFVELMSRLMETANELQLLYTDSSEDDDQISTGPLVLDLLTWLSALSVCKLRALRYVSTLSLYLFQDYLSEHIVELERNYLSKLSKQLALEEGKKRPNSKTITKLESAIEEVQSSKMVTQNIIDNIIKICFVHRFKDVDETLRCMSVFHLSNWIQNYPEYFLKVTFLKYFGWLLSDSSSDVRAQVLKILPQIITRKHSKTLDNSAIRQFFERFKERIFEVALKDENLEVRINAVYTLSAVVPAGYLEESEYLEITCLIFDDNDIKVSSHSKNSRLLAGLAKFFSKVVDETCTEYTKGHDITDEKIFDIEASSVVKLGIFAKLLNKSLILNLQKSNERDSNAKIHKLFQAAEFLFPYFGSYIQDICHMLVYDGEYEHPDLLGGDGEENNEDRQELLLPNNNNNVILYLTTLHGLCCGGVNMKNQPKSKVSKVILPQYETLLSQLPIHTSNVLFSILGIFNLFDFDDWIQSGCEKRIVNVVQRIVRAFTEITLSSDGSDIRFRAFSQVLLSINGLELNELDELWLNQITHIKIQLNKFLDEYIIPEDGDKHNNDGINTLYTMFLNKLVLLGKVYPIELDNALMEKLLHKHYSRISKEFGNYDFDTVGIINFKLLTLWVTWQLQKWTDVFEKAVSINDIPQVPLSALHSISKTTKVMNSVIVDLYGNKEMSSSQFMLLWSLINSFLDTVVSLNVVQLRLPDTATSWKQAFENVFPSYFLEGTQNVLLQVYLYIESLAANEMELTLDRSPEEAVYFNDIESDIFVGDCEKQLLVYTLKLKGLSKLDLLEDEIASRLELNKEKLGLLYESILDDSFFKIEKKTDRKLKNHLQQKLTQKAISDDENSQQEAYSDIDLLENDPVIDSEL